MTVPKNPQLPARIAVDTKLGRMWLVPKYNHERPTLGVQTSGDEGQHWGDGPITVRGEEYVFSISVAKWEAPLPHDARTRAGWDVHRYTEGGVLRRSTLTVRRYRGEGKDAPEGAKKLIVATAIEAVEKWAETDAGKAAIACMLAASWRERMESAAEKLAEAQQAEEKARAELDAATTAFKTAMVRLDEATPPVVGEQVTVLKPGGEREQAIVSKVIREPDGQHDIEVLPIYEVRYGDGALFEVWRDEFLRAGEED